MLCRNGDDRQLREESLDAFDLFDELFLGDGVYLIYNDDNGYLLEIYLLGEFVSAQEVDIIDWVSDEEVNVCIVDGLFDGQSHGLLEGVCGFEDSWRVREDDLVLRVIEHSDDAVSGGLCFCCDDAELLPDELVPERGFPDVRFADDAYESGSVHGLEQKE